MKKVLILAHAFPPAGGAGAQRAVKFVKYLPRWGWRPIVLAAPAGLYQPQDPSLMRDIPPEAAVHRTLSLEPSQGRALAWRPPEASPGRRGSPWARPLPEARARRLLYWLYLHLAIPDRSLGWVPFAVAKGWAIGRKEQVQAIYATGNPFSSFLGAWLLHRWLRVPFVLDFRDAWALNPYRQERSSFRRAVGGWQERGVLAAAAGAIFATEPMRQDYAAHYPSLADKFVTIPNGYDEEDFTGVAPLPLPGFTITHIGKFTDYRRPDTFLRALAGAREEEPGLREEARALFIGEFAPAHQAQAQALGLEECVSFISYLPHAEVVRYLTGSRALLLVGGGDRTEQTSKVFEYLAAGRPILALVPADGAAAQVVRYSVGGGYIAHPQDVEGAKGQLRRLWREWRGRRAPEAQSNYPKYSRAALAGELAKVLEEAARGER